MFNFLEKFLARILMRSIHLDRSIPLSYMAGRSTRYSIDLLRGLILIRRKLLLGRGARVRASHQLSLDGGLIRLEEGCIVDCLSTEGVRLGRNFKLGAQSRMFASGSMTNLGRGITVGDNVGIGEFAYIGGAGGTKIGSDTIIGQYFSVHPENHVFADPTRTVRDQGVTRVGIEIGAGCWIGAKVTITDGVTIGPHSIIAAGSVVTSSFPDHSLIAGVPARLIRKLDADATKS